jgi:PIN domain nuclease of toxin-antitoxin system
LKLLLDTHVILWSAAQPERLPAKVAQELERESNELWFSPISIWEILLLAEKKRIMLKPDPEKGVRNLIGSMPLREAVINQEVAIMSRNIKLGHQDPADRFIAATSLVYGLKLVTADARLINAEELDILPINT